VNSEGRGMIRVIHSSRKVSLWLSNGFSSREYQGHPKNRANASAASIEPPH
jgi:hypothetical protein